jgi:Flp pilus assembly protein CpaB
MTVEPMALGAVASTALSTVGYIGWRLHRSTSHAHAPSPFQLLEAYVRGQADATRERERRTTIVASVAVLPSGATLVDQRADGTTLTIRMPARSTASMEPPRASR